MYMLAATPAKLRNYIYCMVSTNIHETERKNSQINKIKLPCKREDKGAWQTTRCVHVASRAADSRSSTEVSEMLPERLRYDDLAGPAREPPDGRQRERSNALRPRARTSNMAANMAAPKAGT